MRFLEKKRETAMKAPGLEVLAEETRDDDERGMSNSFWILFSSLQVRCQRQKSTETQVNARASDLKVVLFSSAILRVFAADIDSIQISI